VARCEAAGRPNNEDNYIISSNLTQSQWGFEADKEIDLAPRGTLLVVCDGMGGMNAGEVASEIAVQTIKDAFSGNKLTDEICKSPDSIKRFIEQAIIDADTAIKKEGNVNAEHKGMGSTIVLAWFINGKVYVGWCGDSRAYCYNPVNGLQQLSHDHSYVQELVDAGKITADLAFNHPNSNVITRSLGDPNGVVRPEVKEFELHNNDIILLCSDGLCGYVRDAEIEATVKEHQTSMVECRDALWNTAEKAPWGDNVTIELLQVISGAAIATKAKPIEKGNATKTKTLKLIIVALSVLLALTVGLIVGMFMTSEDKNNSNDEIKDSTVVQSNETISQEENFQSETITEPKPVKPKQTQVANEKKTSVQAKNTVNNSPKKQVSDEIQKGFDKLSSKIDSTKMDSTVKNPKNESADTTTTNI
jgi:serine/threonine protein phosphatase PrpC